MTDTNPKKRTWAEISLRNMEHNYRTIRGAMPPGCRFLGVVKADAYGHGSVAVARLLQELGADYLAVSCLDEALELRGEGVGMPILILGHTPAEYTAALVDNGITQAVSCLAKAEEYSAACAALGRTLRVHIMVDTGMSRLGFLCDGTLAEDGVEHIARACGLPGLDCEGIFTHFAVADEPGEENEAYTRRQFALFSHVLSELEERHGVCFRIRHCANSGAVVRHPEYALDMVRPGILLYGYGDGGALDLRPCMRFVSTVSTIKHYEAGTSVSYGRRFVTERRTRIGVLAAGYADGIPRASSNRCSYFIRGKLAPQVGSICMDMCMLDLTDVPEAEIGDEVEIFGPDADLELLAEAAGTISYELLCSVTKRVPRVYAD